MRPLRLRIEGFTAFKDAQEIDFSDIDLFAIAGPTGAGKTSILDAMQWALFGEVPRMSRNLTDLISLGSDTANVTFDFRLQGVTYQVSRVMRRSRGANAQLDELLPSPRSISSGVNAVNAEIVKLVGLKAETFAMSVVLPQGKFARYFEASPAERRGLLREIYNLNFFEEMRSRASAESKELGQRVAVLEQSMEDSTATPQALEAVVSDLTECEERRPKLQAEREAASANFAELQAVMGLLEKRVNLENQLATFTSSDALMQGKRDSLEWNRKAQLIRPKSEESARLEAAWNEVKRRLEGARDEAAALGAHRMELAQQFEKSEAELATISQLEAQVAQLQQLQKLQRDVADRQSKLEEVDRDLSAWAATRKAKSDAVEKREAEVESLDELIAELLSRISSLDGNSEKFEHLKSIKNSAEEWQTDRRKIQEIQTQIDALAGESEQLRRELSQRAADIADLDNQLTAATNDVERLSAELESAKTKDLAAALRAHVHVGDACPVCEQVVHVMPATAALDLAGMAQQLASANERQRTLNGTKLKLEAAVQQQQTRLQVVEAHINELGGSRDALNEQALARHQAYVAAYGADAEAYEQFCADFAALQADAETRTRCQTDAQSRQQRAVELRSAIKELQSELRESRERGADLEARRSAAAEALAEAQGLLPAEAVASPADDAKRLQATIDGIRTQHQSVAEAVAANAARAESNAALVASLERDQDAAQAATDGAQEALKAALVEHGFGSVESLRTRLLTPEQSQSFESELREFERSRESAAQQLRSVETEINGRTATALDLEAARATKQGLDASFEELLERTGELRSQRQFLSAELEKLAQQRATLETARRRRDTISALAEDLKTHNFQNYVFQDLFDELVAGASERLMRLSQRYALDVDGDAKFFVIDQDNAGERRSIETLSGGETFLASLALALQLSQQVQDAAGALSLDSLFIDEGFGTLDPETLETVAEAVEALRDTGRVVGIITHIAELTNRLPVRLRVNKSVEGSQVVIERD